MARLAQLLASHGRILVLDAASTRVQVGLLREGLPPLWHSADDEAGKAVFAGTDLLLGQAGLRQADVAAFVYCEGPGSMLGIRTVAMTLRTWVTLKPRPVYAYRSLAIAARYEWVRQPRSLTVIADARRESWHAQNIAADGILAPLQRLPAPELPATGFLTPENFRAWSQVPPHTATSSYDLSLLLPAVAGDDLLRETNAPDAFQHEAPDYRKWSAQLHSAATVNRR